MSWSRTLGWILLACLPAGLAQRTSEDEALIASWRESLELDLAGEVVEVGPPLVTGRGRLARDGEALALVARALAAVGREATAENLLANARIEPEDEAGAAHLDLARASLLLGTDRLSDVIRLLAPEGPSSLRHAAYPESWLTVGRAWSRAGEAQRAEVYLERFLELAPLHPAAPSAWHMRAQHAIERRDGTAAAELRARGEAAARWQSYYHARRLQVREDPDAPLPRLGLAQLWMEVGEAERARVVLEELLRRHPNFVRGWSHLGEVERQDGRPAHSLDAFRRALELDPENAHARLGRARLGLAGERPEDARADLEWLVSQTGDAARRREAHLWLARLELASQQHARAEELYARYRDLGGEEPLEPPSRR